MQPDVIFRKKINKNSALPKQTQLPRVFIVAGLFAGFGWTGTSFTPSWTLTAYFHWKYIMKFASIRETAQCGLDLTIHTPLYTLGLSFTFKDISRHH